MKRRFREWRKFKLVALGLAGLFAVAGAAAAKPLVMQAGPLVLKADAVVLPLQRPKDEFAPAFFRAKGEVSTVDGTHPPALREAVADLDADGALDPIGLPTCGYRQLVARTVDAVRRVCGGAIVGTGVASGEVAFPEQDPIPVSSPMTLLNGGVKNGVTTLFLHGFITVPTPAAVVGTATIRKIHHGHYGLRAVLKVPRIAGGSGSITDVRFEFGRYFSYKGKRKSYDLAKCSDGHLDVKVVKALFQDETGGTGTAILSGTLLNLCTATE
jgi:hypothetical protein